MYVTKLSPMSQRFLTNYNTVKSATPRLLSIALGSVLGECFELPPALVEDSRQYFRVTHGIALSTKLSTLNELLLLNIDEVEDLVYRFYDIRCNAAYPKKLPCSLREGHGIPDFFRLTKSLDDDTLAMISQHPVQLTGAVIGFSSILKDLEA